MSSRRAGGTLCAQAMGGRKRVSGAPADSSLSGSGSQTSETSRAAFPGLAVVDIKMTFSVRSARLTGEDNVIAPPEQSGPLHVGGDSFEDVGEEVGVASPVCK